MTEDSGEVAEERERRRSEEKKGEGGEGPPKA